MPPTTHLRNAHSNLNQEQFDSNGRPLRPAQLQSKYQGYSKLSSTPPQALGVAQRSAEETHTSSIDHTTINNCEGSYASTATSLEAPNHQGSCSSYQDQMGSWNSTTAMFQGARGVNIHGQARFFNITNHLSNPEGSQSFANFERFVSFDALHDSSVQDLDRPVHQVIRDNTLKQLQDWIDNPVVPEQIIWLHGPASIGKTALALEIARSRHGKVAGTFFFSRLDASRNDGNRLFTTLAWQLAVSIPDVKSRIIHSINERPDLPKKGVEAQFEYLVARPFAAMKEAVSMERPFDLVLIIDGVDECVDIRLQRRLLKVIGSAIRDHRVPLRFIISSRPEAYIQETFDQFECPVLGIDLAKFGPAEEIRKREETITRKEEELKIRELELERREAWIRIAEIKEQEKAQRLMEEISRKRNEEERKLEERMAEIRKKEEEAMRKPVLPLLADPILDTEPSEEEKMKIKKCISQNIQRFYEDGEESFKRRLQEAPYTSCVSSSLPVSTSPLSSRRTSAGPQRQVSVSRSAWSTSGFVWKTAASTASPITPPSSTTSAARSSTATSVSSIIFNSRPKPATTTTPPISEREWARRQAEQAKEQQERFRLEQEKKENQRLAEEAEEQLTRKDLVQLYQQHEARWKDLNTFDVLRWDTFPWPLLRRPKTAEGILESTIYAYLFTKFYPDNNKSEKDRVKEHIRRWHPDRFNAKYLPKVIEDDKERVKEGAGAVVRGLNAILTKMNQSKLFG